MGITSGDEFNINSAAHLGVLDGDATRSPPRVDILVVEVGGVAISVVSVVDIACGDFDATDIGAARVSEVLSSALEKIVK